MAENNDFLTTQIITYIGNKRILIGHIQKEIELIKEKLNKKKLVCADLFSGCGIVARMLKRFAGEGLVTMRRGSIELCDLEGLRRLL